MGDSVFRTITSQGESAQPTYESAKPSTVGFDSITDIEPREAGDGAVLEALGIGDHPNTMPSEEKQKLMEIEEYVIDTLTKKGVSPTLPHIKKEVDKLRAEMGLDEEADPLVIFDKLGGVLNAWKNLSFIKDLSKKKSLFKKLSTLNSSKDINDAIFKEMEKGAVWR